MNYEFFNIAGEDQFMDGFFKGGEPVVIKNMNPDLPLIESVLPALRMRCFVTVDKKFKPHRFPVGPLPSHQISEDEEFREVSTRLETVWFFPSIMRGLLIYRGTTEISDDEGADVLRALIRHEVQSEEPESIEYYRDLQIRLLDRGVDMDMSKAEETMQKAQKSLLKVKNIPKFADEIRQKALGNRPRMPMPEPGEMMVKADSMIAGHNALLDRLEVMARKAHAEHGHLMEINLGVFDMFRGKLSSIGKKMEETTSKLSAAKAKLETIQKAAVKEMSARMKDLDPKILQKPEAGDALFDPDGLIPDGFPLKKKVNPWHDRGFPFVVQCRRALEEDPATLRRLAELGIGRKTVKRMWMGVNRESMTESPADWGLKRSEDFTLPAGLVLPRFNGPVLNHIKINPAEFSDAEQRLVPGSVKDPLYLPSATLIELPTMPAASGAPLICVADELQALFMEQEVGDCCSIIALSSPGEKPGRDAAEGVKNARTVLVVRPEKWLEDSSLKKEWDDWSSALKTAEPLELEHGRTVFESRDRGSDIRQWVFDHLPESYAAEQSVQMSMPEKGCPPGNDFLKGFRPQFPDVKGLAKGIHAEVHKAMEAKFAPLIAKRESMLAEMKTKLTKYKKYGVDPEAISMKPDGRKQSFTEMGNEFAAKIRSHAAELEKKQLLTPEAASRMESDAARVEKLGVDADAHKSALLGKFESMKLELDKGLEKLKARVPPEKATEKLKEHGLDPDAIRTLTREDVQRMYDQGRSLSGAILTDVDLSGLDLSGIDLSGCQLRRTSFKGTKLDNAKLVQALGNDADFSEASLKEADLERGIFSRSGFSGSDLSGASARQGAFKGADFSKSCLRNADFDMCILEKTDFTAADLHGARINMCLISGRADQADFRESSIRKSVFKSSSLKEADFSDASVNESLFSGVEAQKVRFTGADLDKLRTGRNSRFTDSDFSNASLRGAALRESDFSGSDFRGADLANGLIDSSQLVRANLNGVSAKGARFTKSNLEAATMRASNIHMGGLRKARLVDTDLRGSNLFAVDFYKSVIGNTRFEAANLKRSQLHGKLELLEDDS